jgi:hypothetical protein
LFCRWWNYPIHTLHGLWANDQHLWGTWHHSQPPLLYLLSFSVMMPWCSKSIIKWWLTCFWGLHYCYFLCYCLAILVWHHLLLLCWFKCMSSP